MRQVGLLPAGCQIARRASVLHYGTDRVIYASSLAVYVLDPSSFRIQHILSLNQKAITSIAVSALDSNLLVVTGRDGTVTLWNISEEENLCQMTVNGSVIAGWNPLFKNQVGILSEESLRLCLWDTDRGVSGLQEVLSIRNDALRPCVFRWNPKVPGWLAIGCTQGAVYLFRVKDKTHKLLPPGPAATAAAAVVDLQWDRLSTAYLLVAYSSHICLWDADSAQVVHAFDKQAVPISGIAWMDWTAGNFASINSKNSFLKVWNASQRTPLESIKLPGDAGLLSLSFCPGGRKLLYACADGAVGAFDLRSMKTDYLSAAGHTETIFACRMSPVSPNVFATASYDNTVKLWTCGGGPAAFTLTKTLRGLDDIVYSVDWAPSGRMVVAAAANGLVCVWDSDSCRELARYLNHTKASYCAAWNQLDDRYILTTSADCSMNVLQIDPSSLIEASRGSAPTASRRKGADAFKTQLTLSNVKYRFVHPAPVFGAAWSPFRAHLFSSCCQDGVVRVFNFNAKTQLVAQLSGHNARAFSVAWSPLLPCVLASGSDDQSICVWKIDEAAAADPAENATRTVTPTRRLLGHTGFVRALCWSYEHSALLLSGSWDYSIRLWDTRTGTCLHTLLDHVADVYAIASHRLRPFGFLSASRDTTVRLWELEGVFTAMRYRAVWDMRLDRLRRPSAPTAAAAGRGLEPEAGAEAGAEGRGRGRQLLSALGPWLSGQESALLAEDLLGEGTKGIAARGAARIRDHDHKADDLAHRPSASSDPVSAALRYYAIFSFFCGGNGCMEVLENALLALASASADRGNAMDVAARVRPNALRCVFHSSEALGNEKSAAVRQEAGSKMGGRKGELSNGKEDQLMAAAAGYAKLGDFGRYCAIMLDLGKWEAALAVAPAVSLDYWRYLTFLHAQQLADEGAERCVPFYLSVGKDAHAIDYYLQQRDTASAMVIAKMSEQRQDCIPDYTLTMPPPVDAVGLAVTDSPKRRPPLLTAMLSTAHIDLDLQWSEPSPAHSKERSVRERTEREVDQSRDILRDVAACAAKQMLLIAQPMLAAAHYLSVNDAESAVDVLLDSGEPDLAYALAACFGCDSSRVLSVWADRAAALSDLPLALDILSAHPHAEVESGLLLSRYCCDAQSAAQLLGARGMRAPGWWAVRGKEEEAIGSDADAATALVIAQQFPAALQLGTGVLRRFLRDPWALTPSVYKTLHALKFINAEALDEPLRGSYMGLMLWFCAHEAASKGLMACAANMLQMLLSLTARSAASFVVADSDISYQMLVFRILAGQAEAAQLLEVVMRDEHTAGVSDALKAIKLIVTDRQAWESWQKLTLPQTSTLHDSGDGLAHNLVRALAKLGDLMALPSISALNDHKAKLSDAAYLLDLMQSNDTVVLGSLLPVANQQLKQYTSLLSRARIQGAALRLDEEAFVSASEAAQWRRLLPFSPLLTGQLLHT